MMDTLKVLFVWDDSDIQSVDLSNPEGGNIGVGGTDFLFGSIPHELGKRSLGKISVLHRHASNTLSPLVTDIVPAKGEGLAEALKNLAKDFDLIVARASDQLASLIEGLPTSTRVIAWAHNHLRGPMLNWLGQEPRVVAIVNVGREQMLLTRLSRSYGKSTWIDNPVYETPWAGDVVRGCRAVYMGALVPSKGFLSLAKMWPAIKKAVPHAELDVIGSIDLYGAASKSDRQYLQKIHDHLDYESGRSGVHFHGKLGAEKSNVLNHALVGLPNPTGFTETSCLSALEMSVAGLAIVAPKRWGFCDTVNPQYSGILAMNRASYVESVVSLLSNPESTQRLGLSGRAWVMEHFSHDRICSEWQSLFQNIDNGRSWRKPCPDHPTGHYPHGFLYKHDILGPYTQSLRDLADKVVGWSLKH